MSEANSNVRRETLRLETNVPVVGSLLFDSGLPVNGRYGDQVLYTIATDAGERVIYVDTHVSQMFEKLGLRRGEPFKIGKFTCKDGNRRGVEWKVRRLEPEETAPLEPAGAAPPLPASENGTANQVSGACERQPDVPQPITPAEQPTQRPRTPIPFTCRQDGQMILSALVNMIDVCAASEQYAQAKGMELHFSGEDVRALAITCFINTTRGGAR